MKANPGGRIAPKMVIGRDGLIREIWETIDSQSVVMTAERRIGKTTVLQKMQEEPAPGWLPVYQDLERCHSTLEFAMVVYEKVHQFLSKTGKLTRRSKELLTAFGGAEIGGIIKLPEKSVAPWKEILTHAVEDLVHENEGNTRLLFLWDEMPYMLNNISKREGEPAAMQVLDHLRWLRQTYGSLRMIITGSIGLHHVITSLKEKDYANAPVNDMAPIEVPPLAPDDARKLATLLIAGEELGSNDPAAAAAAIANEADCFAFYIQNIVKGLKSQGREATPDTVSTVVTAHLNDTNDPWQLIHYRERIATYYPHREKPVLLILDYLAVKRDGISINDLLAMLKSASTFDDREHLLRLLSLMVRDHYLKRDDEGRFLFRFPLIRRWWKLNRGL